MKKLIVFLLVFSGWAGWAAAQDEAPPSMPNRLGLGIVFNDESPLSARLWFGPKVGIDVGFGLKARRVDDLTDTISPPSRRVSLVDLNFDLGIPVNVLHREKVNFVLRPGFALHTRPGFFIDERDPRIRSIETTFEFEFNGTAGFEYFPIERASFSLLAGFAFVASRPAGTGNTFIRFESLPSERGVNFSFRYYVL
jgi:hypothetical protein